MKTSILAIHTTLGLALISSAAPLVHAEQQGVAVETRGATPFMSGGIGNDQQAFMRRAGKDFNLRFEFSERRDNEFIVGTELLITDMRGNPVFALASAGPMVNVRLPDGQYRVIASYQGENETRLVTLRGKAGQDMYFHWNGNVKPRPIAAVESGAKTA